jgi:hypothetical protein
MQPKGVVCKAQRAAGSLADHGDNVQVHWRPDAGRIAVLVRQVHA